MQSDIGYRAFFGPQYITSSIDLLSAVAHAEIKVAVLFVSNVILSDVSPTAQFFLQ